jgi:hypothetical protein
MSTVYSPRFRWDSQSRFVSVLGALRRPIRPVLPNVDRTLYKSTIISEQVSSQLLVESSHFTETAALGHLLL